VQINGKVRAVVAIPAAADKDGILAAVKADEKIAAALEGKTVVKEIVVPGKIVNIVIK
jgi:leucyl-tRNA synthetase